jgi:arsenate reductase
MSIVIYQKPTCTTCRQVYAALKESGVDFAAVNYYLEPIPKSKLLELLRKMRITPRELLRTKEVRPIVEKGARAILARPAERLKEIL